MYNNKGGRPKSNQSLSSTERSKIYRQKQLKTPKPIETVK